jgi:hypothetical protein
MLSRRRYRKDQGVGSGEWQTVSHMGSTAARP